MPIKTRRWNDPAGLDEASDFDELSRVASNVEPGLRVLVCRYRPRGVAKADETWDVWYPDLGPSRELHRAVYAESASRLPWPQYRKRYLLEQQRNKPRIEELARRVRAGETITLLCSSACVRESRCHRSLLKELIEAAAS